MSSSKASSKISSKTSLSKLYSSIAPSSRRYNKYSYGYPKEKMINYKFKSFKMPKQPSGRFPVFVRRFGKWKNIGFGSTPSEAIFKGKEYSQRTLGRSFYIGGRQPSQILPGFRTKKEKVGQIFIQKTKYPGGSTLGSRGEKSEIQLFRNLKKQFMPIRIKKRKKKGGIFYF